MGADPVTFANPEFVWFGAAVALFVALGLVGHTVRRRRFATFLGGRAAATRLSPVSLYRFRWERLILLGGAALALGVAAGDPITDEVIEEPPPPPERQVMIAIDVSASMQASDVVPTRLAAAVEAARSIIRAEDERRIGLLLFAGEPYLLSPPTGDRGVLEYLLSGVVPTIASAYDPGTLLTVAAESAAVALELPGRGPGFDGDPAGGSMTMESGAVGAIRSVGANAGAATGPGSSVPPAIRSIVVITDSDTNENERQLEGVVTRMAEAGIIMHFVSVGSARGGTMVMPRGQYQLGGQVVGPGGAPAVSRPRPQILDRAVAVAGGSHVTFSADDPDAIVRALDEAEIAAGAVPRSPLEAVAARLADAPEATPDPAGGGSFPARITARVAEALAGLDLVSRLVAAAAAALLLESLLDMRRPGLTRIPRRKAA